MPIQRTFKARIDINDIRDPASSVGAHLSAKLQCFGTDERTLTDELCDMLCIWLGIEAQRRHAATPTGLSAINLLMSKTTPAEEVRNGADLELIVSSPFGRKRCLIQAKVLDPDSGKLRCDSTQGWRKLRQQLVAARKEAGELVFLLIYVPGGLLDNQAYTYGTYEQGFMEKASGTTEACLGATLIPVDALLSSTGRWRYKAKLRQPAPGVFIDGIAFWQLLLELLLCRRSVWTDATFGADPAHVGRVRVFRTLEIGAGENPPEQWAHLQEESGRWLPSATGHRHQS